MDFKQYFDHKKELNREILALYEDDNNSHAKEFIDFIKKEKIEDNIEELRIFLRIFSETVSNHHNTKNIINIIKDVLSPFVEKIKASFSNLEIFDLFSNNKFILLILFELKVLAIEEPITAILRWKRDVNNTKFCHFFYPELKNHLDENDQKIIEDELKEIDPNILTNFSEKRQEGENDSYICKLIRQDSTIEFISYVNRKVVSINEKINHSIFETNPFLIENEPSLIEYSAFCGSIEIFQYLRLNGADMNPSLWTYAIHSNNPSIIHLLEEFNPLSNMNDAIKESIKCHHNEITNYLLDTFDYANDELIDSCFCFDNFSNLPNNFYDDKDCLCKKLCEFNCLSLFKDFMNEHKYENKTCLLYSMFDAAFKKNRLDIMHYLLPKIPNVRNDFSNNTQITTIDFSSKEMRHRLFIFLGCTSLTYVKLPSSIYYIDQKSFNGCTSLVKVIIPSSIVEIDSFAFDGCYSLTEVIFDESIALKDLNLELGSIGHFAFRNCKSLKEFKVPPSITKIKEFAFENCSSLSKVLIHQSVIFIGNNAFANCSNIKIDELEIPSSLKNIGFNIFYNDESLSKISDIFIIYDIPQITALEFVEEYCNDDKDKINVFCLLPDINYRLNEKIGIMKLKAPCKIDEMRSIINKDSDIFNIFPTIDLGEFHRFSYESYL